MDCGVIVKGECYDGNLVLRFPEISGFLKKMTGLFWGWCEWYGCEIVIGYIFVVLMVFVLVVWGLIHAKD